MSFHQRGNDRKRQSRPGFNKRGFAKNNKAPPAAWFDPPMKALFVGRPPLPFMEPPIKHFKPPVKIEGASEFLKYFESADENKKRVENASLEKPESREEEKKRIVEEKRIAEAAKLKVEIEKWKREKETKLDPAKNANITENPMATLLVARLSYGVKEEDLRQLLQEYGTVKKVTLIRDTAADDSNNDKGDTKDKPPHRGYAFVEYENEESVRTAYKRAEGRPLLGKRIRVDVERGRTVENWLPRRLGGGKGTSRMPKNSQPKKTKTYKEKRGRRSSKYSRAMKEKERARKERLRGSNAGQRGVKRPRE